MRRKKNLLLLIFWGIIVSPIFSKVTLPDVISENMVLQREAVVPIWGTADPGEKIEVVFGKQSKSTIADRAGNWKVLLDPMPANASPATMTIIGENKIELANILVGEVWLCAGQSNMQWEVRQSKGGAAAIAEAGNPNIRLFNVSRKVAFKKKEGKLASWKEVSPESVPVFSGVGYFFALELYSKLGIPIGMINSSYGGSQAEAWTPVEYLAASRELMPCVEREKIWEEERPSVQQAYDQQMAEWKEVVEKAKEAGTEPPWPPRVPDALREYRIAASIYKGMIEPLIPFRIRGVMWYQGESNEDRAEQYELLLPTMILSWRERWGQGDFPFAIVQLPNFRSNSEVPEDKAWSHIRDAQLKTHLLTSNTGLIVTIDIGEGDDIHPGNKKDVGKRLYQWALADVYGQQVTKSGPILYNTIHEDDRIILIFEEVGNGLQTCDGKPLAEFAIAGEDGEWKWAKAKIEGKDRVIVWSEDVPDPKAVRYAFNNNPVNPNLTNDSCIPASPFRTDDWPGPTDGKR